MKPITAIQILTALALLACTVLMLAQFIALQPSVREVWRTLSQ